MFSFGVTICELLTGINLENENVRIQFLEDPKIALEENKVRRLEKCDPFLVEHFKKCTSQSPHSRPKASNLITIFKNH